MMKNILDKFKIPTLLGLGVILFGIGGGVFLVLQEQIILSKASPDLTPQNITISNTSEISVTISWQTSNPTTSFITFGQGSSNEQTVLDDRDTKSPESHFFHYITIKNLLPKTTYQYKIVSGKVSSDTFEFTTAAPASTQTGVSPVIGSVLDGNEPVDEGVAYLSIAGADIQSSPLKQGNFLIPLSQIRKIDLSDTYPLTERSIIKLTVFSPRGGATALFKLKDVKDELPILKLGENLDLTVAPTQNLEKFDLNGDGAVNTSDYSTLLRSFGKPPKEQRFDLNSDGVVDKKDADLLLGEIQKSGNQ